MSYYKLCTVCYPLWGSSILLGRHKDTLGARKLRMVGKWNGFGGKFQPRHESSIESCAIRETIEESGLYPSRANLIKSGEISFLNVGSAVDVHFFFATEWTGQMLMESDEMEDIRWHPLTALPYEEMMRADKAFGLPYMLHEAMTKKKVLTAMIVHDENMEVVDHHGFNLKTPD